MQDIDDIRKLHGVDGAVRVAIKILYYLGFYARTLGIFLMVFLPLKSRNHS